MPKSKRARRVASAAAQDSISPTTPNRSTQRCIESIVVAESPRESSHTHVDRLTAPRSFSSSNNNLLVSREPRATIGHQAMQMQTAEWAIEAKNQADIASARYVANYHRQNDRPHNTKS